MKLYHNGSVTEREPKPESEWVIDPVFLSGIGDDSRLKELIEQYFQNERDYRSSATQNK